jgi:glycogen(starch) synthase
MRLLISANSFYPNVGGYETVAFTIARELALHGNEVKVLTLTTGTKDDQMLPFEVYRNPRIATVLKLLKWCEVYIQNNVSYKFLWPLLLVWRPLVCVHHTFYSAPGPDQGVLAWRHLSKHLITLLSTNISVSEAVARRLLGRSHVISNPYQEDIFFRISSIPKTGDLLFVGRLVSDKGTDLLLNAMSILRDEGLQPRLIVAGSGPERKLLLDLIKRLRLQSSVTLVGEIAGVKLNSLMNAHRILVIPSRRGETFGVVALEGIACGCVVVGSSYGGLPEAIGKCGRIFPCGDPVALAKVLADLLRRPEGWNEFFIHAKEHLEIHRPAAVAESYSRVLTQILNCPEEKRKQRSRL